jgi:hypothetical protein
VTVEDLAARVNELAAEVGELRARVDEMHAVLSEADPADEDPLRRGHVAFEADVRRQQEREVS